MVRVEWDFLTNLIQDRGDVISNLFGEIRMRDNGPTAKVDNLGGILELSLEPPAREWGASKAIALEL